VESTFLSIMPIINFWLKQMSKAPNKFLQTDKIVLSCLLQNAQKPRQHDFAAEERR
jgi:hypothetical protein